eukprot:gene4950-3551_t
MSEEDQRIAYCKAHNIHHLLELLATKVLVDRPENPFAYLRELLDTVEVSEQKKASYDPTQIQYAGARQAAGASEPDGEGAVKKAPRKITIATLGLNNAGKTTIISALGGELLPNSSPTVGFTPVHFHTEDHDICLFDLGGAANFRDVWVHYFHDCHGLIYVIDSASDDETLAESLNVLRQTLAHKYMQGKPTLILCNKKDLEASRLVDVFPDGFLEDLLSHAPYRVSATCGLEDDDERDEQVEWLLKVISDDYDVLGARVQADMAEVKEEKKKAKAARLAALADEEK